MMDMVDFLLKLIDDIPFFRLILTGFTKRSIQLVHWKTITGANTILMDTEHCDQHGQWYSFSIVRNVPLVILTTQLDPIHATSAYEIEQGYSKNWHTYSFYGNRIIWEATSSPIWDPSWKFLAYSGSTK